EGTRMLVLAPVIRAKKGFHAEVAQDLQKQGWGRLRVNGKVVDLRDALVKGGENPLGLGRYEKHTIDVVVDRVVIAADARQRIAESIESALKLGDGAAVVSVESKNDSGEAVWTDRVFSSRFACAVHPECALAELEPRLFSFNSPNGACPECHGLGIVMEFDEALIVPDESLSLADGAIAPWKVPPPMGKFYRRRLRAFCTDFGVSPNKP